jgi:hypothetical protein
MMNAPEITIALGSIVEALEELGVNYHVGGSVASSLYGIPRLTIDADLVADLHMEHVRPLVKQLEADYYIDADAVRDAIRRRSSFNAIHLDTMMKVDVFIPKTRPFDQEAQSEAGSVGRRDSPILKGSCSRGCGVRYVA